MRKQISILLNFLKGLLFYYDANRFIFKHKLWHFLIFPGVIGIFYMLSLFLVGIVYFHDLSIYINNYIAPDFLQGEFMVIASLVFLWASAFFIGYVSYQQIILIFFSPILGHISNVIQKIETEEPRAKFSFIIAFKDFFRSIALNFGNIIRMVFFTLIACMSFFIPIIGLILPPALIILILSYYGGAGLIDFSLDKKEFSIKSSSKFNRRNRAMTTGVGFGFCAILLVPFIGWMAAPGYGTVAATLAAIDKIDKNN